MDIKFQIIIFDKNSVKMKKSIIFFGVIVILVMAGCKHKSEKDAIKIMTMNIRYDNPGDSLNPWSDRIKIFSGFISKERPDILSMQEVLWNQYKDIDSVLSRYGSVGQGREDGVRAGELNPVFYSKERFDLVRTITFWLSESPEIAGSKGWGASLPRIVTWMELVEKKKHQHFFLFNTHFAHDSDSARIMSSNILLNEVEKITEGLPFIITGDFNMLPSSTGYGILTGPAESEPLLYDSYLISEKKPAGPPYTFNGFSEKPGEGRIDFIFVKKGLKVLSHKTSIVKDKNLYISDHWPVTALISIN